jgi:Tfp pilus assembly protein PilN
MSTAPVGLVTGSEIPGPNMAMLATMPRVDLMPPEIAENEALRRLQMGCVAAVIACGVAVGSVWWQAHSTVNDAKKNLVETQNEQSVVNAKVSKLAPVAAQFAAVENANKLVQQALGGEVRWSAQLRDLSTTIPANVWLTNMTVASGTSAPSGTTAGAASSATPGTSTSAAAASGIATITFQGTAGSRYDVANWINQISGMKGYVGATFTSSQEKVLAGQVFVDFTSTVQITSDVLSGRYSNLAGS